MTCSYYGAAVYGVSEYGIPCPPLNGTAFGILIDWNGTFSDERERAITFSITRGRDSLVATAYGISVDWDQDGSFTNEADRTTAFAVARGRESLVAGVRGYEHVRAGKARLILDNHDRRYDPYNLSSPLYGYLKPNRPIKITATDTDSNVYDLFTGWVRKIIPQNKQKRVIIEAYDGIDWLGAQACPQGAIQTAYAVSQAIDDLVKAAAWPFSDTSGWTLGVSQLGIETRLGGAGIENNGDTIPYWWSDPNFSIWDEILEIADAFAGNAFISKSGVCSYRSRNFRDPAPVSVTQTELGKDIQLRQPWEEIKNNIKVYAYPRQQSSSDAVLWTLGDVVELIPGEIKALFVSFAYEGARVPALAVADPVASVDYLANSTPDGTGTDLTADLSVTKTVYATQAYVEVENTGASTIYVTFLQLKGIALHSGAGLVAEASDTDSQNSYGKSSLGLGNRWVQSLSDAQAHADYAAVLFSETRRSPDIMIYERPSLQYSLDLFDQIDLDIEYLDISGSFQLAGVVHEWEAKKGAVTTWYLEPTPRQQGRFWVLGESELGIGTKLEW